MIGIGKYRILIGEGIYFEVSFTMLESEYIEKRLKDQIAWYSKKSTSNKKWYKRLKYLDNALALLIVPASYYSCCHSVLNYFVIVAGLAISFSNFMQSINKYHENWIQYRSTAELLKHEKYLYETKSGGYKNCSDPFNLLVERCESIISSENIDWAQLNKGEPCKKM